MSVFLSTLSLRRATGSTARARKEPLFLSTLSLRRATPVTDQDGQTVTFLSTLSLRRATCDTLSALAPKQFLSTLSLRRATPSTTATTCVAIANFYPRSPCGERRKLRKGKITMSIFLSTLSLRRATLRMGCRVSFSMISIHALLAESDQSRVRVCQAVIQFLSTLSLRRATSS